MGEVVEGLAGGAVAVADGVFGPEVGPVGFPSLGVETAMGGDAAEEGEGLVAVVGEVAGAFAGMVFGMGGVVAGEAGAVDAGDFGGVVDPVGAEAEGISGEGGNEEVGDERRHEGGGCIRDQDTPGKRMGVIFWLPFAGCPTESWSACVAFINLLQPQS